MENGMIVLFVFRLATLYRAALTQTGYTRDCWRGMMFSSSRRSMPCLHHFQRKRSLFLFFWREIHCVAQDFTGYDFCGMCFFHDLPKIFLQNCLCKNLLPAHAGTTWLLLNSHTATGQQQQSRRPQSPHQPITGHRGYCQQRIAVN